MQKSSIRLNFIYCLFFLFFSFRSISQSKDNNSLLWRISGNGLTAPSYLYGTIHLNDERVFNFGDSLYQAISNTEGFAMELNPQQLTLFVIDQIKQEISNSKKISEILSESDYKKYGPLLAKKLGRNQTDITTQDIIKEKNKWISEKFKTGKMETFVDPYLYDIARRQGKWTGGIEDLQDQLNIMNDVIDKSDIVDLVATDKGKEDYGMGTLIDAYINADLDAIAALSNNQDSLQNDKVIVKRNIRMAARMDSMARLRTMVFAVGCAHLPGSSGIIELLRKKGFHVDPVKSSKKIKPEEYVVKDKPIEWETNRDENELYQVTMPGKAEELKLYGLVVIKVNIDFSRSSGYFTSVVTSPFPNNKLDSAMDLLSEQVFPRKKSRTENDITVNGVSGKRYSVQDDDAFKKGYILHRGNKIFMAFGFATKINKDVAADIDRFLESFTILREPPKQATAKIHYVDSLQGFELDLPSKPELMKEFSGVKKKEGVKTALYSSADANSGTSYVFATNTLLAGKFIQNDSIYLSEMVEKAKARIATVKIDTSFYENNIRVHELAGIVKQNSFLQLHARYYIRNNRSYALVATFGADKPIDFAKEYFDSFHFRDFPLQNWKTEISQDSVLSAWCPTQLFIFEDDDRLADKIYDATDSIKAHSYDIVAWHLADYYWAKSDSLFWASRISTKIGKDDSLVYEKAVMNGDVPGWEFERSGKNSLLRQRFRILRYGDEIYTVMTVKRPSEINDENTNRFFESIKFQKPAPVTHLLTSHAGLLLSKLFSNDSTTAAKALEFLEVAPLQVEDLDTLHRTLLRIELYEKDSPLKDKWYKLILSHINAIHDSSSFNFARDEYRLVVDLNAELKNALLEIMTSFTSVENFNVIADLLNSSPPEADLSSPVRQHFKDTCRLTALVISKILPLLDNDYSCLSVMDICNALIDSNLLDRKRLSPYISSSVRYAIGRVELLRKDVDNYYSLDAAVIKFLGNLKSQAANSELKRYLLIKDKFIKYKAMMALMRNGIQVDQSIYMQLAADKHYRTYLYNFLKGMNKLSLFPVAYKTQKMFAESNIWEFVSDNYDPLTITFLSQKQVMHKGQLANFYFFKVGFDHDKPDITYLGSNGPFNPKTSPGEAESSIHMYYEDKFDPTTMQQQINALLKRYADDD